MIPDARKRLIYVIPAAQISKGRQILGAGSFQTPMFNDVEQKAASHYIAGIHPTGLSAADRHTLESIPGMQAFPVGTAADAVKQQTGLTFKQISFD